LVPGAARISDFGTAGLMRVTVLRRTGMIVGCGILLLVATLIWVRRDEGALARGVSTIHTPSERDMVACPEASNGEPPVVILALGQSNAGNHGNVRRGSPNGTLWFDAHCYPIADPLAGGTGTGGSIWSRLAASLDDPSERKALVLAVLAVDATTASDWTHDGPLSSRLHNLIGKLRDDHLEVSAVLWQQGEAEARTGASGDAYAAELSNLIRQLRRDRVTAPVFLARSTRCRNSGSEAIRRGVARVATREAGVFLGPDTDLIGEDQRYDGCHFNDAGLQSASIAWKDVLQAHGIALRSTKRP
jgi:hypothetical protein